jgi:hypothetical protein
MLSQISIGAALIALTVIVHAISLEFILKILLSIHAHILVRWRVFAFSFVIIGVFVAHIIEICIWALFYYSEASVEQIPTVEAALYFSTSSFTTVGFGDLVLSEEWRLLSSFEAINGMILFGWSTAFIFGVVRHVYSQIYAAVAANT